ncbi:MAG: tetratricopeptide repeat protein [Nannocystis sp.]|uniref:tetratricopeptide repeat protein n=1 Tax=Nannocystis sp. TaxID=1962667 RepID=UPI0024261A31|nr:tetratricopeptide repeat protein [Nannocystis sp.]MBK9754844.1 tetratricopeptide repeat protein [Nannocystis sp.]
MSELRSVLFQYLTSSSDVARRDALATALASVDLVAARAEAKQDPGSGDAAAKVVGRLILDGAPHEEIVDAAKVAAQRAPREAAGNDVALLAGMVVWRLGVASGGTSASAQAEPYFRRVRRNDPAAADVLAFYRDMFSGDSDASQLMQVLVQARRALKKEDVEPRFALAQEMADLAEKKLGSLDRAIEVWRSVLREDGYDPRAAKALERLYREGQKWTALVELLKEEYDRVPDRPDTREDRITRLLEIAELYRDQLRLDAMALGMLQKILDINPRHAATIKALADTYGNANRWNDLLAVYGRLLDAAKAEKDGPRHVDMLRRIASIYADNLNNSSKAMELLAEAMTLAPGDKESRNMLARIHESRKDWRALIDLRKSELATASGAEALELRSQLARLAEDRLGDRGEAIATWREILEQHGDVEVALQALQSLYEKEGRWSDAAEILRRKVAQANDEAWAVELLTRLADMHAERLQQPAEAVQVWAEVARRKPGHERANAALRAAYVAAARWDDLVALYEQQGKLAGVLDVLYAAAEQQSDEGERLGLYRRIAALARDRVGEPERGLKALEQVLALQPDNQQVARQLLPIYRERGDWAHVLAIYEVLLVSSVDDDDRLDTIAVMRDVALQKLNDPRRALHWAGRAYQIRPGDEVLRAGLESVAERADAWDELGKYFEARVQSPDCDNGERLELLDKLATIARERLGRPEDAQRYLRKIIELEPTNRAAMASLEEIYTATEQWQDLATIYNIRLGVTTDPGARLATLRRLGILQEQRIGDLDQAIDTYKQIQAQVPSDAEAMDSLTRLFRARERWAELAEILQRRLDAQELGTDQLSDQIPLLFELSQIYATRLRSSQKAIAGFLQILDLEPDHLPTIDALQVLRRSDPGSALAVMRGLLPYYRSIRDHGREAEAMEVIVMAEPDSAARTSQLVSLANLYAQMEGRQLDALRVRRELLVAQPDDAVLRAEVERAARELGRMDLVASAYEQMLQTLQQRADAAEAQGRAVPREALAQVRDLQLARGVILRDDLRQGEEAEHAFAAVLEREETHQAAYEALEELLKMRGANEALMKLYRRRVDVIFDPEEQKRLLSRITYIARDVLGQREVAIRTAEELLDLVPDDLKTMEQLAAMYELSDQQDDHYALEELLGRWAELVDADELRHSIATRRAALRMDKLNDAFGAVDLLGQVLAEDPSHAEARRLLERLLDHKDVQLQAAALLEPIYLGLRDHANRVRILEARRAHAEELGSTDEATGYLLEMARIHEFDLDNLEAAFGAVRLAYLAEPRRSDIRSELQRLGIQLEKQRELVDVWQQSLDKLADTTAKVELLSRIAVVLDDHLQDQAGARKAYAELLALEPPDLELARRATVALARLHRSAGDAPALIDGLRALLRFIDKDVEQVKILLEIAELQRDKISDAEAAAGTYQEVLDIDPGSLAAMDALERIYVGQGAWEPLCRVLRQRVMAVDEPGERARLWRKIGEIQRDHLKDAYQAIEAYQEIVDIGAGAHTTLHALDAIVRLNEGLERWPEVEEGLRRQLELAEDDESRAALLGRAAGVVGEKLGRYPDAIDLLEQVLKINAEDAAARGTLTEYLGQDDSRERVIAILHPLYEAEHNWPALLDLEERQARHQPAGRRRLLALLQVARTHEERLGDVQRAFAVLSEALAEAGDQPELADILDRLERLGSLDGGRDAELLDANLKVVDSVQDPALQARVLRTIGRLATGQGRLDEARRAYERLLEHDAGDVPSADALEQVLVRQADHDALAELLVRRGERAEGDARDAFFMRAAEIYRGQLSRPEDAIGLYERVRPEGAAGPAAQAVLAPLYEGSGRWHDLARFLEGKLGGQSGRERTLTELRLATIFREQLGDLGEGLRHFAEALRHEPEFVSAGADLERYLGDEDLRPQVIEQLEPVFTAAQDWPRLIRVQELRLAEAGDDTQARIKILTRTAQIQEDMLENYEAAFDTYGRIFKEDPTHKSARDQLTRLAHALARSEALAVLLTAYVSGDAEGDERDETLAIVREAAELWQSLDQPARAVPLYERLIQARPSDTTVFPALELALTRAEQWKELAEAYWREADTSLDEQRQVDVLMRLSELALGILGDSELAIRAFVRVLETQPEQSVARDRLERVYENLARWDALIESLRQRLERAEDSATREAILLRIAELQDQKQDNPDAAIDTLESLLAEQPGLERAMLALEQLVEHRAEHRVRLFAILRPLYEAAQDAMRMVAVDEWQLTQTEDPVSRHELLREIAALLEPQGADGPGYAFHALVRALAEPGPEGALEALDSELARVSRQYGFDYDLRQALLQAETTPALQADVARRVALLQQAAQLAVNAADNDAATTILRHALTVSPDDRGALALLDETLALAADFEGLRAVLDRRVEVATDDEERIDLLRRLARLVEEGLGLPEAAEAAWRRILDIEPANSDAMLRLRRLYAAKGDHVQLIGVLERQIENTDDLAPRQALRKELARIHREGTRDRAAEIEALRALLMDTPDDDEALNALAQALLAVENYPEAATTLLERVQITQQRDRKVALLLEVARLHTGPMNDAGGAIPHYESIFGLTAAQPEAVADLMKLVQNPASSESAAALLIPQLDQAHRYNELAQVWDARAKLAENPGDAVEALRQLAKIRFERLGDIAGSLAANNLLMDRVGPDDLRPVLEASNKMSVRLDKAEEHVDALARRAARAELDPQSRVMIAQSAADMAEGILGDRTRALNLLATLLDAGIADETTCRNIERLARAASDRKLLARVLAESAKLAVGQPIHPDTQVRLGDARFDIGELEGATEAYAEALDDRPGFAGAVAGLERVLDRSQKQGLAIGARLLEALDNAYHVAGNKPGLTKIARLRLEGATGADRIAGLEALARLCDEGGGSADEALDAWGALILLDAESPLAIERIVALSRTPQLLLKGVKYLAGGIDAAVSESRPCTALCLETTRILLRDLRKPASALQALNPALKDNPDNLEALELQIMASRADGNLEILHDALTRYARLSNNPDLVVPLLREAVNVAEAMANPTLALADLRALIDVDQNDGAAWEGLLKLLQGTGDLEGLSAALEQRISITTDSDEQRILRHRLANLMVHLGGLDEAITVYNDMLAARPDDLQAIQELEALHRRLKNWKEVRDVLERKLDHLSGPQRAPVLEEMAHLAEEQLSDLDDAAALHRRLLTEAPTHTPSLVALWRLLDAAEKWNELAELLEQFMAVLRDLGGTDQIREVGLRLAELYGERLADPEKARQILVELLEGDADFVPAILALSTIEEQQGNDEAMRALLLRAQALQPQGVIGASLQLRLSVFADSPEKRREHLETALHLNPANVDAARQLLELSRKEGYWEQVAYLQALLAQYVEDDGERKKLILERVDILMTKVGDPEEALRALAPVYEAVQDDVEVNRRIADALFVSERFDEAGGMYGWLIEVASAAPKKTKMLSHYLTRMARIQLNAGDVDTALDRLKEAYRIDTTNPETLVLLTDVYAHKNMWEESLKTARAMLLQNVDQSGLVRRGDIYMRLAAAHVGLKEQQKALSMLKRGLEEDPQHPEIPARITALQTGA